MKNAIYYREYRQKHLNQRRAIEKKYRRKNRKHRQMASNKYREEHKEYFKKYREEHKPKIKKQIATWMKEHKDYYKNWFEKNPGKAYLYWNERDLRKRNAEGSHTFGEWELLKKQYGFTCPACGKKEPEIKLSEDHIIPLSKGGSDYIENIQPLCRNCNSKKHTKIIKYKT